MASLVMNGGNTEINTAARQQERHPMLEAGFKFPFWFSLAVSLLVLLKPILPNAIMELSFIKRLLIMHKLGFKSGDGLKQMEKIQPPRLLKSHLPYHAFPSQALRKKLWYGSWFDHVLTWWQHRNDENVLFLKYEDMKKDPRGAVKSIADFLDVSLTEDTIDNIVEFCSFKKMKENKAVNISLLVGERVKHEFVRKGVVGDWMNFFTVAQNKEYEKIYEERMKGSGLDFEW
ncbi:sulfotransferase 1B1-like isoform X2 [Ptychodera flava]|uniref:sulfotransferase 1B1-like isoform X2 n=1 Tax=Ptychodera flava TaxID=63121 RepID=UPI00396A8DBB